MIPGKKIRDLYKVMKCEIKEIPTYLRTVHIGSKEKFYSIPAGIWDI